MKYLLLSLLYVGIAGGIGALAGQGGLQLQGLPSLVWLAGLAMAVNWLAFVPAAGLRSERFYDLTGGITYLAVMCSALAIAPVRGPREWATAALVVVWAVRLSSFLFLRIRKDGKDGRFDAIKTRPTRFFMTWTLQGLWVFLTALAALTVITGGTGSRVGWMDVLGWMVWGVGFGVEVVADRQKSAFKADPANAGRFIDVGLWSWSRHPNYLGEITLWAGIAISAASSLTGWQWTALVSPVFVTLLLMRGSGVPLLEARADARWGGDPGYEAYKQRVPVIIPKLSP